MTGIFKIKVLFIIKDYVKFFLWDTAGQEKYRAINKMFFRDAKIILIVYSIVDKHSFDEVDFWINYPVINCSVSSA